MVVARKCLPDALWQRLLNFGKLILLAVLFVLLGVLVHPLVILQRVIVVIDPHHAIERISQSPVKRRAQSFVLLFESRNRLADLQKPAAAALDRHCKPSFAKKSFIAISFGNIAHCEVILDIALKQVPALLAYAFHDGALSEGLSVLVTLLPSLRPSQAFSHQRRAEVVEQFSAELVAVGCQHRVERWQSL